MIVPGSSFVPRGMEPVGAKGSLLCLVLLLYFQFLLPHHHLETWSLHSAADHEMWLNLQMMLSWTLTLENISTDSSPRRQIYKKKKLSTWCFRLDSFIQHGCQSGAPTAATLSAVTLFYFEASGGNWIHSAPHNTERAAGCWLNLFRQEQRFLQEVGGNECGQREPLNTCWFLHIFIWNEGNHLRFRSLWLS